MRVVSNAVLSFSIPSSILNSADERVLSSRLWYMKGPEGPFEFEDLGDTPIKLDKTYSVLTKTVHQFLFVGDMITVLGILYTEGGSYRLSNHTEVLPYSEESPVV